MCSVSRCAFHCLKPGDLEAEVLEPGSVRLLGPPCHRRTWQERGPGRNEPAWVSWRLCQTLERLESWRRRCRQSAPEGTRQLHRHRFAVDGPLSRDRPLRNAITARDAGRRTDELDISGCHPLGHIKDDPPTLALSSRQTGSGRSQLRL